MVSSWNMDAIEVIASQIKMDGVTFKKSPVLKTFRATVVSQRRVLKAFTKTHAKTFSTPAPIAQKTAIPKLNLVVHGFNNCRVEDGGDLNVNVTASVFEAKMGAKLGALQVAFDPEGTLKGLLKKLASGQSNNLLTQGMCETRLDADAGKLKKLEKLYGWVSPREKGIASWRRLD